VFTSNSGTISGSTFTAGATTGQVTITANQAGSGTSYFAATPITMTVHVKLPTVISIDAPNDAIILELNDSLDLLTKVSSDSDATITFAMDPNDYVSLSDNTVTANAFGQATITASQIATDTHVAKSKTFTVNVVLPMTLFAGSGSLTNNSSVTVDFSNGDNIIIACYESEHVTVANGSNSYVLVNYGRSVYTYASGTLTKITVFPGTAYPVYGGDAINGQGIAILVQSA
jgi:hypothetical protein